MQSQLKEFLEGAGTKPYRELIQYHIRRTGTRNLIVASLGVTQMLPANCQELAMSYIDATNERFAYDQTFWTNATCRQAFEAIIEVALAILPIKDRFNSVAEALK